MAEPKEVIESNKIFTAVSAYYGKVNNYVTTGLSSDVVPEPITLLPELGVAELLTFVDSQAEAGAGYSLGLSQEAISTALGIVREVDMLTLSKSAIYLNLGSETSREVSFYDQTSAFTSGVIKGAPTCGAQC